VAGAHPEMRPLGDGLLSVGAWGTQNPVCHCHMTRDAETFLCFGKKMIKFVSTLRIEQGPLDTGTREHSPYPAILGIDIV
jgi:hypothetical protein